MIFLAKSKTNNEDYKVFESSVEEAAKQCPAGYIVTASYNSLIDAYTARNATILGMNVYSYELIRALKEKENEKKLNEIVSNLITIRVDQKHIKEEHSWIEGYCEPVKDTDYPEDLEEWELFETIDELFKWENNALNALRNGG